MLSMKNEMIFMLCYKILYFRYNFLNRYFWLYKISYMWYAPLGFCISVLVGWLVSVVLERFGLGGEPTIYTDESKTIINADLFTPMLAKRLRQQNARILEKNFSVIALD